MSFNLQQARADGAQDTAIAAHLAAKHGFNLDRAHADGVTDSEIAEFLAARPLPSRAAAPVPPSTDQPIAPEEKSLGRRALERVADVGLDLSKGVIGAGEAVVGVADLLTGNAAGDALAHVGYDPKRTKEIISSGYSAARKAENARVQAADGFVDTAGAMIENPATAVGVMAESAPLMLGSAAAVRSAATGLLARAGIAPGTAAAGEFLKRPEILARLATVGSAAEGATAAGSIQEGARQEGRTWSESAPYAVAGGAGTAAIGRLAAKVLPDADVTAGTIGLGAGQRITAVDAGKKIVKGAAQEGIVEELPQSAQEQVAANLATDRPWAEGVPEAAAQGMIAGLGMGAGATTANVATQLRAPLEDATTGMDFTPESIEAAARAALNPALAQQEAIFRQREADAAQRGDPLDLAVTRLENDAARATGRQGAAPIDQSALLDQVRAAAPTEPSAAPVDMTAGQTDPAIHHPLDGTPDQGTGTENRPFEVPLEGRTETLPPSASAPVENLRGQLQRHRWAPTNGVFTDQAPDTVATFPRKTGAMVALRILQGRHPDADLAVEHRLTGWAVVDRSAAPRDADLELDPAQGDVESRPVVPPATVGTGYGSTSTTPGAPLDQKAQAKDDTAQRKAAKAEAQALFTELWPAMQAKLGPKFGDKELRAHLDQLVKWEPSEFIALARKFQAEQSAVPAADPAPTATPSPAPSLMANGKPFTSAKLAAASAKQRKLDMVPVEVPGGWGLAQREAAPSIEAAPSVPPSTRKPAARRPDGRTAILAAIAQAQQRTGDPAAVAEYHDLAQRVSEDAPAYRTRQTQTPEFKRWFGDSKVVDAQGAPLVVYHGTAADVTSFDPLALGANTKAGSARRAFFFAASPKVASGYAMLSESRPSLGVAVLRNVAKSEALPENLRRFVEQKLTAPTEAEQAEAAEWSGYTGDALADPVKGANVLPLYLSLQNPLVVDYQGNEYREQSFGAVVAKAKAAGHDGVIFRNAEDSMHKDYAEVSDIFAVFKPEQIKSATGNSGAFDSAERDIVREDAGDYGSRNEATESDELPARLTVSEWTKHQLRNHRGWALGALTRDQIADIYGEAIPQVAQFDHVVQAMDAERNRIAEIADALVERWRQLPSQVADRLADTMHRATLAQFDPDKHQGGLLIGEPMEIRRLWESLPADAQQLYRDVREQYRKTLGAIRDGLATRAERAGAAGARVAAQIRLQFDNYLEEGPYFPLARFGDQILIADRDGERLVETFEGSARREVRVRQLRAGGWTVKLTSRSEYSAMRDGAAGAFVGDVLERINALEIDIDQKAKLMDGLNQLAISVLPDASYRKHFAHRKGTPGFSTDAMRAFASSMQHAAHHIVKIRHAHELVVLLDDAQKEIREASGDVDVTERQQVINELARRLDYLMSPTTHPVTAAAGQVGFVMSLAGSVAAGLVNATQTPLVTLPWLGARHGFDKASAALLRASRDYFGGRWEKWSGFVAAQNPNLDAGEKGALRQLEEAGLISLTQAHDLTGTANTDSTVSRRAWVANRAMKIIGWTFHVPEVFNRQVTALAAYRLARATGQEHDAAVEHAAHALRRTHFDYAASNRARFMQGNFTRVITMFKQYSQQMTYLLWRNAYLALKSESPAVKREARRMLLGISALHFAAAGTMGQPLGIFGITPLLSVLAMGMGDGDDPWDWQAEYRNLLADVFGKDWGEAIAHGPARLVLNVDLASRVGLGDLWVRPPQKDAEGRDLVEAWMLTLLGPTAGYLGNLGTAAKAFDEGKFSRGVEAMVPKFVSSALKAYRYESEGVRSWRGDDLGIELDTGEVLATALGFQPSRMAEMYEGRGAIKGREARLQDRRSEIVSMWVAARMAGDSGGMSEAVAAARHFNARNPQFALKADTFRQAYRAKRRNAAQIKDGVHLSRKRESLREEGRFANTR